MTLLGHWTRQIAFSSVAAMALAAGTAAQANSHDDSFTIAVLPDTQNYIDYTHQKVEGFPFVERAFGIGPSALTETMIMLNKHFANAA